MPPGKLCPAKVSHAEGPRVSQSPAREPRHLRHLLDTWDSQQVTRTTSGLGGRISTPWPRAIFSRCSSSVKLEYSLIWLTARKEERNHHYPWISLCFSHSIIYHIIKMKYFVYFKIFFSIFPSLRDPIRGSHLRSQSRMYVLQYVMNLSWRESPAFNHL